MTLVFIALIGVIVLSAMKLKGFWRRVPATIAPVAKPERLTESLIPREPWEWDDEQVTVATISELPETSSTPRYIVTGQRIGVDPDRMAAVLTMMSGPGICAPRNP